MDSKIIKHLNKFSVVLQIFGYQYFSFEQLRKQSDIEKFPSFGYTIYFIILLVNLPRTLIIALYTLLIETSEYPENEDKNLNQKSIFGAAIGLLMYVGFISMIVISIINFYLRTKSLKKIYVRLIQIEEIYDKKFGKTMNYRKLRNFMVTRLGSYLILQTILVAIKVMQTGNISRLLNTIFYTAWYLLAFYYTHFVKLINLQIGMVSSMVSEFNENSHKIDSQQLTDKLLAIKKIILYIKECARLIDRIMTLPILGLFIVNTAFVISFGYKIFLVIIGIHHSDIKGS